MSMTKRSVKVSPEALQIASALGDRFGLSQSEILEQAIHDLYARSRTADSLTVSSVDVLRKAASLVRETKPLYPGKKVPAA